MPLYPGDTAVETFAHWPDQMWTKTFATNPAGQTWDLTPVQVSPGVYQASKVIA